MQMIRQSGDQYNEDECEVLTFSMNARLRNIHDRFLQRSLAPRLFSIGKKKWTVKAFSICDTKILQAFQKTECNKRSWCEWFCVMYIYILQYVYAVTSAESRFSIANAMNGHRKWMKIVRGKRARV